MRTAGQWRLYALALTLLVSFAVCNDARAQGKNPVPAAAPQGAAAERARQEADVEHELDKPVELEFIEQPLSEAFEHLSEQTGRQFVFDTKALEDAGVATDTPRTFQLKGITLRSALKHFLRPMDLTAIVIGPVITITTPEKANATLSTRAYKVDELVRGPANRSAPDFKPLIHAIRKTVAPTSWDEAGGPGSMKPVGATLVVSQTQDVQAQLGQLIKALQSLAERNGDAPVRIGFAAHLKARDAIEQKFSEKATLEFVETPLNDALETIKDSHGIQIILDLRALEDAGIGSDTPVTLNVRGINLRNALKLLLKRLDLDMHVLDELLVITTPEAAHNQLEIVVYPVGDLANAASVFPASGGRTQAKATQAAQGRSKSAPAANKGSGGAGGYGELVAGIAATVEPTTWNGMGGPGDIVALEPQKCLVVLQTKDAHDQIVDLLIELRRINSGKE